MNKIKKLMITLVALLAVTTGAWATDYPTGLTDGQVLHVGDTFTPETTYHLPNWSINSYIAPVKLVRFNVTPGERPYDRATLEEAADGQYYGFMDNDGDIRTYWDEYDNVLAGLGEYAFEATENSDGLIVTKSGANVSFAVHEAPAAPTGPEVAWDKASKTGTFGMPGGNVELEPEYYPQAALTAAPTAINDVPATTDGAIVKAGTVANIGSTETAQGTVMYYVSPTEMTDAALLALAADAWTADVPTAQSLAQGQAYVYYYVRGNNGDTDETTFSDGDILSANALTVTLAAAPTYAVTFAEGTDPNEWTASPNTDVKKGQTVTVTYTGTKKVLGVKAEKKAAAAVAYTMAKDATAADMGKLICADGHIHANGEDAECTAARVAKIIYLGTTGHATYTHGLALALTDEGQMAWEAAKTACNTTKNTSTPVTDATWLLASKDQWNYMLNGAGGTTSLRDGFSGITGASNMTTDNYWSSTESASSKAWVYGFNSGDWYSSWNDMDFNVRACLAF